MTIMGIDPGLNATGYGVITADPGRVRLVSAGTIRPPTGKPLPVRLHVLYDALAQLVESHHPTTIALEKLYTHHQYLTTAALMAHARGMACLVSAQCQVQLIEYLPTRVKKALTGNGHASKDQVARAVGMWLGVDEPSWSSDTTDALALAIAHAHISQASVKLQTLRKSTHKAAFLAMVESAR